ncbi:MAG: endonuclease III [Halobacteria archaeon]|nr:endonuclease III [Halobacteria archaeon]
MDTDTEERAAEIVERLKDEYPEADTTLDFETPYQLLVATILSAQCTDERVNKVTPELFEEFSTAEDMAEADIERIKDIIRSTGFYNSKAEYIKDGAEIIVEEFDGELPRKMSDMTKLPGVGRKTANVVLSNAFAVDEGIAVDTHVQRLSQRLELTDNESPEAIEDDLMEIIPEEDWRLVSHLLIYHGRAVCGARSPDCANCVIEDMCPSSRVDG